MYRLMVWVASNNLGRLIWTLWDFATFIGKRFLNRLVCSLLKMVESGLSISTSSIVKKSCGSPLTVVSSWGVITPAGRFSIKIWCLGNSPPREFDFLQILLSWDCVVDWWGVCQLRSRSPCTWPVGSNGCVQFWTGFFCTTLKIMPVLRQLLCWMSIIWFNLWLGHWSNGNHFVNFKNTTN